MQTNREIDSKDAKSDQKQELKEFKAVKKELFTSTADLANSMKRETKGPVPYYSDHALVHFQETGCIIWNILQKATTLTIEDKSTGKQKKLTNNGYEATESKEEYREREQSVFKFLGNVIKSSQTPVRFVALQEVSSPVEGGLNINEIENEVKQFGFKPLAQPYGKNQQLVIAYDSKRMSHVRNHEIKNISNETKSEGRMQAAIFQDNVTGEQFVVVNVHIKWEYINVPRPGNLPKEAKVSDAVRALEQQALEAIERVKKARETNKEINDEMKILINIKKQAIQAYNIALEKELPPVAINDIKNALEELQNMPVFMVGDFNRSSFPLPAEAGQIFHGLNANVAIIHEEFELDSCDNVIINEKGCKLLAALQSSKSLTATSTLFNSKPVEAKQAELTSTLSNK